VFLVLAVAAVACPWHGFETHLGDRLLANLTNPVRTMSHPCERLLDRSQEATVGLVQLDLKFRFGISIRLVNQIASQPPAAGTGDSAPGFANNSPCFSNNRFLYRCKSAGRMGVPREQHRSYLAGILHLHGSPRSVLHDPTDAVPHALSSADRTPARRLSRRKGDQRNTGGN
jgi:hypothetical protein